MLVGCGGWRCAFIERRDEQQCTRRQEKSADGDGCDDDGHGRRDQPPMPSGMPRDVGLFSDLHLAETQD